MLVGSGGGVAEVVSGRAQSNRIRRRVRLSC